MTFDVPEIEAIDQGIYNATLRKVSLKKIESGQYAGNTIRIWTFDVDVNGVPQEVTSSSSLNTGPRSKSYAWLSALLGRAPVPGEKGLDPTGRPCRVHLIIDDESGYNKVVTVLPAEKGQKAVAAISEPPDEGPDDPDWLPPMEEPPLYDKGDLP